MRWVRFEDKDGASFGIVEGDDVVAVSGTPFGVYEKTGRKIPLSGATLLPPVMPPTIYCAGHNYRDHIVKSAKRKGIEAVIPDEPEFGYRAVNALIGHEADVVVPKDSARPIHYEPELVAVIGKKAKRVTKAEAKSCVFGYTIGNDISERAWQKSDRTNWRAKNMDTFKPMGPWIETEVDLDKTRTLVRVNGETVMDFQTYDVLFDVETCIASLTRYVTLYPGDVLWMGSEGEAINMKPGDVNEIEITGIGVLRNTFTWES
ncbi:MAG: fumarylacetoacetate hydrolase family protein [Rhodospirillales bacterium]